MTHSGCLIGGLRRVKWFRWCNICFAHFQFSSPSHLFGESLLPVHAKLLQVQTQGRQEAEGQRNAETSDPKHPVGTLCKYLKVSEYN